MRLSNLNYNYFVERYEFIPIDNIYKLKIRKYYSQLKDIAEDLKDLSLEEIKYLAKNATFDKAKPKYKGLKIIKLKQPISKYGLKNKANC